MRIRWTAFLAFVALSTWLVTPDSARAVQDGQNQQQGNQQPPGRSGPPAGSNYGNSGRPAGVQDPYADRGRTGPPAGSNYGRNSGPPPGVQDPYANRGRSGPPEGANYGRNSGPPPGVVDPYANRNGSQSGSSAGLGDTVPGDGTFTKTIAPIVADKCGTCHVSKSSGKLSLASYTAVMKIVKAGKPDESELYTCIEDGSMPKGNNKVSIPQLTAIKKWIEGGAKLDGDQQDFQLTSLMQQGSAQASTTAPSAPASSNRNSSRRGPEMASSGGGSSQPAQPTQEQPAGRNSGRRGPEMASSGGGSSQPTPPPAESSGGNGGGAGGASMSLDGELPSSPPPAASSSGAGGASMSLDGESGGSVVPRQQAPTAPAAVQENSFYDMAMNAFARGEDLNGLQFLRAEVATNPSRFEELSPGLWREGRKLSMGIRVGIGLHYRAPSDFGDKPPVIGDPRPDMNNRNNGGYSSGGSSSFNGGGGAPKNAKDYLDYYTGDLSTQVLSALDDRFRGSPARYGAIGQLNVTPIIEVAAPERSASSSSGRSSRRGPTGVGSGGDTYGAPGAGNNDGPAKGFHPGLVFLGEGSQQELLKKAKDEDLDGLIVLDQEVIVPPRTGRATSNTRVDFFTVMDGKKRGYTKSLNYAVVDSERTSGDNPVEDEVSKLFERKVDRYFTIVEMPTLTEEQCSGRLDSLAQQSKDNPLPFLMEASYYVHKGWLNIDVAQEKIIGLVGEETALKIFSEDFATQKDGLNRWLPKSGR